MNTQNPPPNPPDNPASISKNEGINKTLVFVTLIVCASILGAVYIFNGKKIELSQNAQPVETPTASAVNTGNKKTTDRATTTIIDKGLAMSGLQNAEGGKASADYYNKYMTEQVSCQMIAGSIRNTVERIDISPVKTDGLYGYHREYPSPNTAGVKKALELAANFYRKSVRNKLLLSSAGIDPDVVAYVEKFAVFDQRTSDLYGEYAETLQSRTKQIEEIGKARDEQVARDESVLIKNFESKFGIKLQTRQELRNSAMKSTSAEARRFLDTKSPQELAANLIGYSFDNINGYDKWRVDAGEYVFGRIMDSACNPGVAIVDLEVQLRGSSSGQPGLIRSRIIYVKDPDRNLFWAAAVQDLGRR